MGDPGAGGKKQQHEEGLNPAACTFAPSKKETGGLNTDAPAFASSAQKLQKSAVGLRPEAAPFVRTDPAAAAAGLSPAAPEWSPPRGRGKGKGKGKGAHHGQQQHAIAQQQQMMAVTMARQQQMIQMLQQQMAARQLVASRQQQIAVSGVPIAAGGAPHLRLADGKVFTFGAQHTPAPASPAAPAAVWAAAAPAAGGAEGREPQQEPQQGWERPSAAGGGGGGADLFLSFSKGKKKKQVSFDGD